MIKFNEPYQSGNEKKYILEALSKDSLQGRISIDKAIEGLLKKELGANKAYLLHSATAALEVAALAIGVKAGDEVIMPSFTYVSTANAFALRGATIVFVDVDPDTMCIDLQAVKNAITSKTKVVVPVHYAGVSCDMDALMAMAKEENFFVVEDAAQALYSGYKDKMLACIGHFACVSCHETKNIHAGGQGGILFVNDRRYENKVEEIIDKGTNRQSFLKGEVQRYTWESLGSSYAMNQLNVAFLRAQLEDGAMVTKQRKKVYERYEKGLKNLIDDHYIDRLQIPSYNSHNGHIYYIKLQSEEVRDALKAYLKENGVEALSHFEPLHLSTMGRKITRSSGQMKHTLIGGTCLLRLPLHSNLRDKDIDKVTQLIVQYFQGVADA